MNQQVINFVKESIQRLRVKSPKFFFILSLIGASLTLLGYLPAAIDRWTTISVSQEFINFCEDVSTRAQGFLIATLFSAESKPTAMTPAGDVLKKLDEEKYPYTASVERKKVEAAEIPVVADPLPKSSE